MAKKDKTRDFEIEKGRINKKPDDNLRESTLSFRKQSFLPIEVGWTEYLLRWKSENQMKLNPTNIKVVFPNRTLNSRIKVQLLWEDCALSEEICNVGVFSDPQLPLGEWEMDLLL